MPCSTFDYYTKEVTSGLLEWSPIHHCELFWKNDVTKFENDSYKVLLYELVILLSNHYKSTQKAVATSKW
jgi:V-type H+-transporting ATPase subunit H